MRTFALSTILLFPFVLAAADLQIALKIDHATVAGPNLDAMRKALTAAAGFSTEYGGPHSNHATEMALVSFPDGSYLELMGIQAKPDAAAVSAHVWSKFLQNNAGPCAFAMRVPDLSAEVRRLKSTGISADAPETAGRTRPDGTKLVWQTVNVGPGHRGSLFPFLIADLTPREYRAYPGGKPTTDRFGGIARVVIGVQDLEGAIAQYRRAFNLPAPLRQKDAKFGADLAWFEGTPIVLAHGLDDNSWLTRRVREYGDAPCAFVLTATRRQCGIAIPMVRPIHLLDRRSKTRLAAGSVRYDSETMEPVDRRKFLALAATVPPLMQAQAAAKTPKPGGMFVCMHEASADKFDFNPAMEGWAKAGIKAVEPNLVKVREFAQKESPAAAKRLLDDLGLKAVSSSNQLGLPEPGDARKQSLGMKS